MFQVTNLHRRRRQRQIRLVLILVALVYLLCFHFPSPPTWQNNTRADRKAPHHEVREKADFLYHSRFRKQPDLELEATLDEALVQIETIANALTKPDEPLRKIWQTAKSNKERTADSELWVDQNPGWEYEVRHLPSLISTGATDVDVSILKKLVTDENALVLIHNNLSSIPLLGSFWSSYPRNVLRADLLRYLLLWYHGGYYADIDVYPKLSISSCQPLSPLFTNNHGTHNISLVVGVEIDEPFVSARTRKLWHWSRIYGFIQYSLYAPRRFSPLLRRVIVRALAHSSRHAEDSGNWYKSARYSEEDILEVTGPGMFTDALLDVLSETLPREHGLVTTSSDRATNSDEKGRVTWAPFHALKSTIWLDDSESSVDNHGGLVVLPINVWGNGQRHSGSGGFDSPEACINHRFARTWKKGWLEYLFG